MPQEIDLVHVQPTLIAVCRVNTTFAQWPNQWKAALDEVYTTAKSHKIQTLGINVMVYHPRGGGHAEIECGVQVASRFESLGNVICSETPKGCAATITHVGPYNRMRESYQALDAWCQQNNYKQTGTSWEIYGHWNNDASQLRTDLFYLVEANSNPD
jgi:effector-binding domain-containing protein